MNTCENLAATASDGVAAALRAVDCYANQTAAAGFSRLFGADGALLPALTILLTLYIAFFAFSLITGRSRIGISALTPRMMTLGLVLTFATSWVAYQGFVWNLAIGAPDQLAGILAGTDGSATAIFAGKLDLLFMAIADAAAAAGQGADAAGGTEAAATNAAAAVAPSSSFTPANLMWFAALLLLLGTVGVLVTARIALAILLALGPVFIVMALFSGTRGLFVGWLRGVVLTGIVPLFVVIGGGLMMELMVPVIATLSDGIAINGRAAIALFLIACIHMALMGIVMKVAATVVSGWQVFGFAGSAGRSSASSSQPAPPAAAGVQIAPVTAPAQVTAIRQQQAMAAVGGAMGMAQGAPPATTIRENHKTIVSGAPGHSAALPSLSASRARGVGSRFRSSRPTQFREIRK